MIKATREAILKKYNYTIFVPVSEFDFMTYYEPYKYYIINNLGWEASVYEFGNIAIITGTKPFGKYQPDYNLYSRYNRIASRIIHDLMCNITESQGKEITRFLIKEFIKEVLALD